MKCGFNILSVLFILLCIGGCTKQDEMVSCTGKSKGNVRFNISPVSACVEEDTRSMIGDVRPIRELWCIIFDDGGDDVIRSIHLQDEAVKSLYLEGLESGSYRAVFMATTEEASPEATVSTDLTGAWLSNKETKVPFEKDYLYMQQDFLVSSDEANQTLEVKMPRAIGRVEVNLSFENPQVIQLIKKIEVVFDDHSSVNTFLAGKGVYGGGDTLDPIDVTEDKGFFSLPGEYLSGEVRVVQQNSLEDTDTSVISYRFADLSIVPGSISTIKLEYSHPEETNGEIIVKEGSYTAENSTTMLLDNEPVSVMLTREFYVNQPLHVTIDTSGKRLVSQLYSPIGLGDTRVLIKFKRYSDKFFYLAHYDTIPPFSEAKMEIPVMSRQCKFITEDGQQIWIPAQPDLSSSNCELKLIHSDSPYTQKIKAIKCVWKIRFIEASDPDVSTPIEDMVPEIARHICVIAQNMAYMFSIDYFKMELEKVNNLYDDQKQPINKQALLNDILNRRECRFGIIVDEGTVAGLGGSGISLLKRLYPRIYAEYYEEAGGTESEARTVLFHEMGHWLGYDHGSTMTADENNGRLAVWSPLCSGVYYYLNQNGDLPVLSRSAVDDLPR